MKYLSLLFFVSNKHFNPRSHAQAIEQKLSIKSELDGIKKQFDTDKIKNKDLFKNLGF